MISFYDADLAIAATLLADARAGLPTAAILDHVHEQYPGQSDRAIAKAAFWIVTRPTTAARQVLRLYDLGIALRRRFLPG
jgi:hypothetical protein